ncbi:transcriptional accessory protein [Legionella moravica]|uniref:Transcriptional accessory protein n=1 Tax=Legionella moravica TaxID=39962 RepID=A0A378K120_9GAMM|nr:Tex family protein [Legionella moravica]KTD34310.1 transcriptional accessory protein [Legionella moravica]STX64027.1 transcriptional accessory protein [Legionella moravica]
MAQEMLASAAIIAQELKVKVSQVETAIRLLDEGATVPFIARYRKEATEGLDDVQLRYLEERLLYLRELDERRTVVLQSIREQEKLTPELEQSILAADTKTRLEDLYLPFRPKRRTKAQIAVEAGLEPLALALWKDPTLDPEEQAVQYINVELGVEDVKAALEGARHILMEHFAEDADLINELREYLWQHAIVKSVGSSKKKETVNKFSDYFDYSEAIKKIPSHRALALFRGRRESVLQVSLTLPEQDLNYGENRVAAHFNIADQQRKADSWLFETVRMTWKVKLFTKLELELLTRLREMADEEAIKVFSRNLRDLLLAAPAGPQITIGLDPGIRTGVKVVVVDTTGKLLDYTVIFPFAPQNEWHQSIADLAKLAAKHHVNLISIGNGTGSRETERLVADLIKMYPDLQLTKIIVSEAGASVYSASEIAAREFPDLDVTLRGAVSIARRVQDPLAELVKIEAKSIGVGQYQHDVNQARLARCLDGVVEDCVNAVGVDVNTASAALLAHVSGLNETLAKNIVQYRDEHGAFVNREQLKNINRMGEKAFQQAAGFLRIMKGENPLDASCVHPEAYPLVERIIADQKLDIPQIIGNREVLQSVNADKYVDDTYGLPTIRDVLRELEKPGRDPRPEFKTAQFKEGVEDINHLHEGMILEGVVSNVTNFGAFVDIGVHQDGLVHISAMTNRFITDPRVVVKAGDIVTVKVVEVDKERRRIGLSMKLGDDSSQPAAKKTAKTAPPKKQPEMKKVEHKKKTEPAKKSEPVKKTVFNTAMADALAKLKRGGE